MGAAVARCPGEAMKFGNGGKDFIRTLYVALPDRGSYAAAAIYVVRRLRQSLEEILECNYLLSLYFFPLVFIHFRHYFALFFINTIWLDPYYFDLKIEFT